MPPPAPTGAPEVTLRIYRPEDQATDGLVYNVHGGGLVPGDLDTDHARNVVLCRELGTVLVSVRYRLAPGHPCPAGLEDAYTGLDGSARRRTRRRSEPARPARRQRRRQPVRGAGAAGP